MYVKSIPRDINFINCFISDSAKHFLQRDALFSEKVEIELKKWYSEFSTVVMLSVQHGHYFDNRHEFVYGPEMNNSRESGASYLSFMQENVLPRIEHFQSVMRNDIRFWLAEIFLITLIYSFQFNSQSHLGGRHEQGKNNGNNFAGIAAACGFALSNYNLSNQERYEHNSGIKCRRVLRTISKLVTQSFLQNFANILVERTQQLRVEKNKSDKLLRQMLPLAVIQQLKQQRQVRKLLFIV